VLKKATPERQLEALSENSPTVSADLLLASTSVKEFGLMHLERNCHPTVFLKSTNFDIELSEFYVPIERKDSIQEQENLSIVNEEAGVIDENLSDYFIRVAFTSTTDHVKTKSSEDDPELLETTSTSAEELSVSLTLLEVDLSEKSMRKVMDTLIVQHFSPSAQIFKSFAHVPK